MEKSRIFDAVGNIKFIQQAAVAIGIGLLVRKVVLGRNGNTYTPTETGGWQDIDSEEYQAAA